jgi:hypothetical protein
MNTNEYEFRGRVLKGAAGEGERAWGMGGEAVGMTETTSGEPMARLMLRLVGHALRGVPVEARLGMGLVLGTTTGCLAADAEFDASRREAGGRYASPAAFSRTLPSTVAAEVSVKLTIGGPALTVCAGAASTAVALRRAASWLRRMAGMELCVAGGFEQSGECVRGAVVLLGREVAGGLSVGRQGSVRLEVPGDDSLEQLIAWVRGGGTCQMDAGVKLESPPTDGR